MADDGKLKLNLEQVSSSPKPVKAADYKVIYSNTAQIGASPWDLRITFGHIVENSESGENVNEHLVTVVFSPQHAKAVIKHLTQTMQKYEATFGTVHDPSPTIAETRERTKAKRAKAN